MNEIDTLRPPLPGASRRPWLGGWTVLDFIVIGVLCLAPLCALVLQAPWYMPAGLCLAAVVVTTVIVQKHGGLELLGPHFFYDLLRLGRRGRSWDVRVIYAVFLLVGLGLVYWARFPGQGLIELFNTNARILSTNEMSQFAEVFVFTVVFIQNLAVFILTPVYLGSAIAEEKERGSLQLLFTTHLRDREIVLGKLMSRLIHLGAILFGGLPVLSLAQLWGGVDMGILALNFFNTALNLVTVGSISILASVLCKRVVTAVVTVYGILIPFGTCFSVMSLTGMSSIFGLMQSDFASRPEAIWSSVVAITFLHALITTGCIAVTLMALRGQRGREMDRPLRPPRRPLRPRPRPVQRRIEVEAEPMPSLKVNRSYYLPPVNNDPLFWKEYQIGGPPVWYSPVVYLAFILPAVFIGMVFLAMYADVDSSWRERHHNLGYVVKFFVAVLGGLFCFAVGFRACGSIVRERQQKTLDSLLTIPESRERILFAKWLGNYFFPAGIGIGLVGTIVIGTATLGVHYAGAMVMTAAIAIHAAFLTSLGMFLSVISRTILGAYAKIALVILVMVGGTALWGITLNLPEGYWATELVETGLSPVRTWIALAFTYRDFAAADWRFYNRFGAGLAGVGIYALLAIFFWWASCYSFRRERYRHLE